MKRKTKKLLAIIMIFIIMIFSCKDIVIAVSSTDKTEKEKTISSKYYKIANNIISEVSPKTRISLFKKAISSEDVKVYKDGKEVKYGYIGTGMKVRHNGTEYEVSVVGDLNGDGQATQVELTKTIRNIVGLKGNELEGIYYTSADMTFDGKVDQRDIRSYIRYIVFGELGLYGKVPEIEVGKNVEIKEEKTKDGKYVMTIDVPEGYQIEYQINGLDGEWKRLPVGKNTIEGLSEGDIVYIRLTDGTNYSNIITKVVGREDGPLDVEIVKRDVNSITVRGKGGETEEGKKIVGYQYSIDGEHWSDTIPVGEEYTIDGIKSGTDVTVYVRSVDEDGNVSESVGKETSTTPAVDKDKINIETKTGEDGKTIITVNIPDVPEGYKIQYKIGDGEWIDIENGGTIIVDGDGSNVTIRLYNEELDDEIILNETTEDKISPTKPTEVIIVDVGPNSITVKGEGGTDEGGSGVAGYQYSTDGEHWSDTIPIGEEYTIDGIKSGTDVTVYVRTVDEEGNVSEPIIKGTKTEEVGKDVTVTMPETEWTNGEIPIVVEPAENIPDGYKIQYRIDDGEWKDIDNGGTVTVNEGDSEIDVRLYNEETDDEVIIGTIDIPKIDKVPPTKPSGVEIIEVGLNSITIKGTGGTDVGGSGIAGYQYSIDGEHWSETIPVGEEYTIDGIKSNTDVTIYVRSVDEASNLSEVTSQETRTSSLDMNTVQIETSTDWGNESKITVNIPNLPEGYKIQYKIDDGEWIDIENGGTITVDKNGATVTIRLYNEELDDEIILTSITVNNIDQIAPTKPTEIEIIEVGSNSITVKATGGTDEGGSGIAGYQYSIDGENWSDTIPEGEEYTITGIKSDTEVTIYVRSVDGASNVSESITKGSKTTEVGKDVTVAMPETEWINGEIPIVVEPAENIPDGYKIQYRIDDGEWKDIDNGGIVTVNEGDSKIDVRLYNEELDDGIIIATIDIPNIDKQAPTEPTELTIIEIGVNSITVKASGSTDTGGSGLAGYQYSTDGVNWSTTIPEGEEYTLTGLKSGKSVTVYARSADTATNTSTSKTEVAFTQTLTSIVNLTASTTEWTKEDVIVTLNYPNIPDGYVIQYSGIVDDWVDVENNGTATVKENDSTLVARLYNKAIDDEIGVSSLTISNIDKEPPTVPTTLTIVSTEINSITVRASGSSDTGGSDLVGYQYSKDGTNWSNTIAIGTNYTLTEIKANTEITAYARAVDGATGISTNKTQTAKTTTVSSNVTLTKSTSNWINGNVTVTLAHSSVPTGYAIQYKVGTGSWINGTSATVETNNTTVYGRLYNSTLDDEIATSNVAVTNIDKVDPTVPTAITITRAINSLTVKASGSSDTLSGLAGYQYSKDGTTWTSTIADGTTYTFSGIKANTNVTIYARSIDNVGRTSGNKTEATSTTTVSSNVTLTKSTSNWTNGNVTVTLSHSSIPSGYAIQYKVGSGNWTTGTSATVTANNTTVYGRLYNSTLSDELASASTTITNIDKTAPGTPTGITSVSYDFTTMTIVIKATGSTDSGGSGLAGYQYRIAGESTVARSSTIASGTNHTMSGMTFGTKYTVYARAVDGAGNTSDEYTVGPPSAPTALTGERVYKSGYYFAICTGMTATGYVNGWIQNKTGTFADDSDTGGSFSGITGTSDATELGGAPLEMKSSAIAMSGTVWAYSMNNMLSWSERSVFNWSMTAAGVFSATKQ